ncbi:MAG: hypothetical protein KKB70_01570 [Proteobacteria bacterium]|nr:hypothetical protein [Pseudomonadota bacterium]MBU1612279.1 hypothetical protein [Pseudomonadota bacterium]
MTSQKDLGCTRQKSQTAVFLMLMVLTFLAFPTVLAHADLRQAEEEVVLMVLPNGSIRDVALPWTPAGAELAAQLWPDPEVSQDRATLKGCVVLFYGASRNTLALAHF